MNECPRIHDRGDRISLQHGVLQNRNRFRLPCQRLPAASRGGRLKHDLVGCRLNLSGVNTQQDWLRALSSFAGEVTFFAALTEASFLVLPNEQPHMRIASPSSAQNPRCRMMAFWAWFDEEGPRRTLSGENLTNIKHLFLHFCCLRQEEPAIVDLLLLRRRLLRPGLRLALSVTLPCSGPHQTGL